MVKTFDRDATQEPATSLRVGGVFSEDNKREFSVVFDFSLESKSKEFKLKLKAVAHFSTGDDIDDEFKSSGFVRINAPAIAFPYVRTFISNLTLNCGYDPIVLPSYNFIQLANFIQKEEITDQKEEITDQFL